MTDDFTVRTPGFQRQRRAGDATAKRLGIRQDGFPERVDVAGGIIQVDVIDLPIKQQLDRNTGSSGIWLSVVPADGPVVLEDLRDERRKTLLATWVPQGCS